MVQKLLLEEVMLKHFVGVQVFHYHIIGSMGLEVNKGVFVNQVEVVNCLSTIVKLLVDDVTTFEPSVGLILVRLQFTSQFEVSSLSSILYSMSQLAELVHQQEIKLPFEERSHV